MWTNHVDTLGLSTALLSNSRRQNLASTVCYYITTEFTLTTTASLKTPQAVHVTCIGKSAIRFRNYSTLAIRSRTLSLAGKSNQNFFLAGGTAWRSFRMSSFLVLGMSRGSALHSGKAVWSNCKTDCWILSGTVLVLWGNTARINSWNNIFHKAVGGEVVWAHHTVICGAPIGPH